MKTRIITAIVGILVLIGVLFTFDTLVFNFVIAAITLIAIHEVFKALGFGRKEWPMYAVFVPYTLLIMLSSYQVWRRLVMSGLLLDGAVLRHLSGGAQRTGGFCKSQRSGDVFRHRDLLLLFLYPAQGAAAGGDLRL